MAVHVAPRYLLIDAGGLKGHRDACPSQCGSLEFGRRAMAVELKATINTELIELDPAKLAQDMDQVRYSRSALLAVNQSQLGYPTLGTNPSSESNPSSVPRGAGVSGGP